MDLRARLDGYEVTEVPARRPRLRLVWSPASADDSPPVVAAAPRLALLDDYRITRVPVAS